MARAPVELRGFGPRTLAGLVAAARAVNQPAPLARTLETILDQALGLLEASEGSVMLVSADRRTLTIGAARGLTPDVIASTRLPMGAGIAGYVAQAGTPLLLGSDEEVSRYREGDIARRLTSAVSVPLISQEQVVGVLNVNLVRDRATREPFRDDDLALATAFGELAATAIQHAQLYSAARGRADGLAQLYEAGHRLVEAIEPHQVATRILEGVQTLAGGTAGFVAIVPRGGNRFELGTLHGVANGRALAVLRRPGQVADLVRDTTPRVVADVAADTVLAPLATEVPAGAVSVPLLGPEGATGIVVVLTAPGGTDEIQTGLVNTFASLGALALDRAMLFDDVRGKEEELASLAFAVPDPILIVDGSGALVALNPMASELFGLNARFDLGIAVRGRLRSEELEELLLGDEQVRTEVTLLTPNPRTFRVRITTRRSGDGATKSRIMILEDVSAVREVDRLKRDLVAVIGHELRTPLTVVDGYARTLATRGDAMPAQARATALEALAKQSSRLRHLVEDLLLISQVERDRLPLHLEDREIGEVVRDGVDAARASHPSREIAIESPGASRELPVDAVKIEQVLGQLIDNAVKFSDPGTPVTVQVEQRADEIEIRVVDRGIGIFSGDLPTVFERFHQLDGSATRQHGGTGIGLYVVKTLVEVFGGRVGVTSHLGRGSTFWFTVPTQPPRNAEVPESADVT